MLAPPSDERREGSQPSLLPVPDHSTTTTTTSYHYCFSNGVSDGAGLAVINNVICKHNLTAFSTYLVEYLRVKPGLVVPSDVTKVVVNFCPRDSPPMRYVPLVPLLGVQETCSYLKTSRSTR